EQVLQPKLDLPARPESTRGGDGRKALAESCWSRPVRLRRRKFRRVEYVEHLGAEFDPAPLLDLEVLKLREIPIEDGRPAKHISAKVSESAFIRDAKRFNVDLIKWKAIVRRSDLNSGHVVRPRLIGEAGR